MQPLLRGRSAVLRHKTARFDLRPPGRRHNPHWRRHGCQALAQARRPDVPRGAASVPADRGCFRIGGAARRWGDLGTGSRVAPNKSFPQPTGGLMRHPGGPSARCRPKGHNRADGLINRRLPYAPCFLRMLAICRDASRAFIDGPAHEIRCRPRTSRRKLSARKPQYVFHLQLRTSKRASPRNDS